MAQLTIVYWRDIPAQVTVKAGRKTARRQLDERFEKAIDRAAMKAKLRDTDSYLAHWRRGEPREVDGEPESAAETAAAQIEADYDEDRLKSLVANGGLEHS
jgi:hypothetical protein